MKDKFNMEVLENTSIVRRNRTAYIANSAAMEGISLETPVIASLVDGMYVSSKMHVKTVLVVNNLRNTWGKLLSLLGDETNIETICKLHREIGLQIIRNPGELRDINVKITGTEYKPEMPIRENIEKEISEIMEIENITDRAITLMLYLMRSQIFNDGNKRVATYAANHILVGNGKGVLSVPRSKLGEFFKLLTEFYGTNETVKIKEFVYEYCIGDWVYIQ